MSSLFGIISKYKSQLTLLPVTILIFVVLSMILFILFRRDRLMKYVPALAGILLGILFLIFGFLNITQKNGLEWVWRGIAVFVAGCISLATAWLLAIFSSFVNPQPERKEKKSRTHRRRPLPELRNQIDSLSKPKKVKKISRKKTSYQEDLDQTKVLKTPKRK